MVIYKTTNILNGKIYIGKNKINNSNYLGSGKILKESIKKYGREFFIKEIIEECYNIETLNIREIFWINHYNSIDRNVGYNISKGGDGGDTISQNPRRDEIRFNHSEKMKTISVNKNKAKGRKKTFNKRDDINWVNPNKGKISPLRNRPNGRKGIKNPKHSEWMKKNNPSKGKKMNEDLKNRLRLILKQPKTENHKKNISDSLLGNKPKNMREVIIDGVHYESLSESSRILEIPLSTVKNRLKSKNIKFENYKYKNDGHVSI